MADGEDWGALIAAIIGFVVIASLVAIAVMAMMSAGVIYGSGVSLYNYYQAFRRNIRPERPVP